MKKAPPQENLPRGLGSCWGLFSRLVLIAASEGQLAEARTRLARVGIDHARGYLEEGIQGWTKAGLALDELPEINPRLLGELLRRDKAQVLDVCRKAEWEAGHIEARLGCLLTTSKTHCRRSIARRRLRSSLSLCRELEVAIVACMGTVHSGFVDSGIPRSGIPRFVPGEGAPPSDSENPCTWPLS